MPNEVKEVNNKSVESNNENSLYANIDKDDLKNFNVMKNNLNFDTNGLPKLELAEDPGFTKKLNLDNLPSTNDAFNQHTVKKGDTLWDICKQHLKDENWGDEPTIAQIKQEIKDVAKLNHIKDPDKIEVGQVIKFEKPQGEITLVPPKPEKPETTGDEDGWEQPASQVVEKHFKQMDADQDGFVTRNEVDSYVTENKNALSRSDRDALESFGRKIDKIQSLSNDEWGFENDGATLKDLEIANDQVRAAEFAKQEFKTIDADGNGYITVNELDKYTETNGWAGLEQLEVQHLKQYGYEFRNRANDKEGGRKGISLNDLSNTIAALNPTR